MLANDRHQIPLLSVSLALASAALLAGCGPEITGVTTDAGDPMLGTAIASLQADNGMSQNGMSQNGMSQNGMSQNGMSQNGFGTTAFKNWFNVDPALSDVVMTYMAKCAAPAGTSHSWKNPSTGKTHAWSGLLGLAPGFAAGAAPTAAEQQVITACLAAHVNKFGLSVPIAIEGRSAAGVQIPIGPNELTTYSVREACFFGNVFSGDGVFVAADHAPVLVSGTSNLSAYSTARACGFDYPGPGCPPIVKTGYTCKNLCALDATGTFYESCTWNGKTYKALATRLRPQAVYKCGDGVCQATESCGTGATYDSCKADCGVCP